MTTITTRLLSGFDDPTFGPEQWQELLCSGQVDHIYLTWHFQRAWWETLGHGDLLLTVAKQNGRDVALAPFYTDGGMVYFIGSAFDSDYLDFVGCISNPRVLDALLLTAIEHVNTFLGFRFYFVADRSGTGKKLREAAKRIGLLCYKEDDMHAALIDLAEQTDITLAAANKRRLLKLERAYQREGPLDILHLRDGEEIPPYLDEFFEQHISRWADTSTPSRFENPKARALIERFTQVAAHTGWLRFLCIRWKGRIIAYHYGFSYRGRYYWGMPSFAIDLARHSPGQLLIRHMLLVAIEEGAHTLDFGTGTQPFKLRFATHVNCVSTWGLYPISEAAFVSEQEDST